MTRTAIRSGLLFGADFVPSKHIGCRETRVLRQRRRSTRRRGGRPPKKDPKLVRGPQNCVQPSKRLPLTPEGFLSKRFLGAARVSTSAAPPRQVRLESFRPLSELQGG